ncbi:Crp/Fnr family transcriptional regulator [Chitinophaga rhizophila]|uniref:Crp/Fnr family transcriptional regulator n=1 Tax=Chitinophaga rhizophila TaxID=2866212 RepID=A0ABS7GA00_9BACT|nr:Crp/Fnr family transcriptional regulator [Chitinophaga rhizophila]MBW8684491.1 Crp/Fnr family transcriptional regulator [Chitinophaga rhizophila]
MFELIMSNFAMHIALAPEEQEQVQYALQQKTVSRRTMLVHPGTVQRHIYFVNKGCLRMFYTDTDGQEHNICFHPENWWAVDIASFFKEKPSTNSIQALEDTEVYCLTLPQLEALFLAVPKFERFFRILTQNGYDMYQRRLVSSLSKDAGKRYQEFRRRYPGLEQRIAQKHIASYLGITPAFLSMMRKDRKL